jgi:hypothetical protein
MSDTAKPHHLTNDDLGRRLSDVEQGLSAVVREVDAMKQDRQWLRATMLRVLDSANRG